MSTNEHDRALRHTVIRSDIERDPAVVAAEAEVRAVLAADPERWAAIKQALPVAWQRFDGEQLRLHIQHARQAGDQRPAAELLQPSLEQLEARAADALRQRQPFDPAAAPELAATYRKIVAYQKRYPAVWERETRHHREFTGGAIPAGLVEYVASLIDRPIRTCLEMYCLWIY